MHTKFTGAIVVASIFGYGSGLYDGWVLLSIWFCLWLLKPAEGYVVVKLDPSYDDDKGVEFLSTLASQQDDSTYKSALFVSAERLHFLTRKVRTLSSQNRAYENEIKVLRQKVREA